MDTTTSLLVSKIEKLWRKASDAGATPAERQAFEAKALSLMEENRITLAMLELDQEDILGDYSYGTIEGRYAKVTVQILDAVARAYDCRVWWHNRYGGVRIVQVFGFRSDAERVILLARMLVSDAFAQASTVKGTSSGHSYSLRHSFVQGYASAISTRLREAARLANKATEDSHGEDAVKGAALVLVSRREQMHEKYSQKTLRAERGPQVGSYSAYSRGAEAGRNASLSTQGQVPYRKAIAS
jgi:hypothetical protein